MLYACHLLSHGSRTFRLLYDACREYDGRSAGFVRAEASSIADQFPYNEAFVSRQNAWHFKSSPYHVYSCQSTRELLSSLPGGLRSRALISLSYMDKGRLFNGNLVLDTKLILHDPPYNEASMSVRVTLREEKERNTRVSKDSREAEKNAGGF